nr:hypothetical protein [Tanacetum cinerariifolium]
IEAAVAAELSLAGLVVVVAQAEAHCGAGQQIGPRRAAASGATGLQVGIGLAIEGQPRRETVLRSHRERHYYLPGLAAGRVVEVREAQARLEQHPRRGRPMHRIGCHRLRIGPESEAPQSEAYYTNFKRLLQNLADGRGVAHYHKVARAGQRIVDAGRAGGQQPVVGAVQAHGGGHADTIPMQQLPGSPAGKIGVGIAQDAGEQAVFTAIARPKKPLRQPRQPGQQPKRHQPVQPRGAAQLQQRRQLPGIGQAGNQH